LHKINIQGANVEEWREMLRECNKLEKNFSALMISVRMPFRFISSAIIELQYDNNLTRVGHGFQ